MITITFSAGMSTQPSAKRVLTKYEEWLVRRRNELLEEKAVLDRASLPIAFELFYTSLKRQLDGVEEDLGRVMLFGLSSWKEMSQEEKDVWDEAAKTEKEVLRKAREKWNREWEYRRSRILFRRLPLEEGLGAKSKKHEEDVQNSSAGDSDDDHELFPVSFKAYVDMRPEFSPQNETYTLERMRKGPNDFVVLSDLLHADVAYPSHILYTLHLHVSKPTTSSIAFGPWPTI
ncbi:hypothetical protein Hypma_012710 [Hypsizygus marmoreus]|uniref:Uncharacterized protein n=1 Tax=Hypsizygus marmoreus TaxID=39966 RepID=A0A369JLK3_HYPMA|nr:hypothetical protein Hypma_012710 [Hypsizygus marmoreus]